MKRIISLVLVLAFAVSVFSPPADAAAPVVFKNTAAAGYDHFLAAGPDGSLWVWGWNSFGQLGTGDTDERFIPVKILDGVISVYAWENYSAAIRADGSLWLWGGGEYGQLGVGDAGGRATPVRALDDVADAVLLRDHAFALKTDGSMWGWGDNTSGQLGLSDRREYLSPVKVNGDWIAITAKQDALRESFFEINSSGGLTTWGDNSLGQLGNGLSSSGASEIFPSSVREVSMSQTQAIAVMDDGEVWTWGSLGDGILGDGGKTGSSRPVKVSSLTAALPGADFTGSREGASEWAKGHIEQAISRGLIPAGLQYGYRQNITRAEFCRQAVRFFEVMTGKGLEDILIERNISLEPNPFTDTDDRIVIAAYRLGVVAGKGNGIFQPGGEITRQESAVMLRNVALALKFSVSAPENPFPDKAQVAAWAKEAVDFVADRGVMSGTGKGFEPEGKYSREMADVTFNQLYDALSK